MMLDHITYLVSNRLKTAKFFIKAFGYRIQQKFKLEPETDYCKYLDTTKLVEVLKLNDGYRIHRSISWGMQ